MAKYRITAPDGTVYEVTAPDDATEEQVLAYAQQQFQAQEPAQPARSETDPTLWAGGVVPSTDPTDGMDGMDRFAAGYGSAMPRLARGGKQLLTEAASLIAPSYAQAGLAQSEAQQRQEADEIAALDAPLLNTWAGFAGNFAGNALPAIAAPGGVAAGASRLAPYGVAAGQGAAFGALQPVGEQDSRLANVAAGAGLGIAGQGIASGVGALAKRAVAAMPAPVRQSIESARAAGIPLNVAQTSNSAPIRAAQAVTKYLPFSGAGKAARAQQQAFNRAVAKSFGAEATELTDDVMKAARQKLSAEFDEIYSRNDVALTPDTMRRLLEIERRAAADMTPDQAGVIRNQIDRIVQAADDGQMTGRMYQSLRSQLQKAESQGGFVGSLIKSVRSELDDAAAQSVGPDDAARLARVRGGWANLRTTEDALRQVGGATAQGSAAGNVNPASLWPLVRKGSTKEMRELAKIGQNVLKEGINDSGTGQRNLWAGLLTGGAAVSGLGKLVAGGVVAGRALNSNTASKLLQQGRPTQGLARLVRPAPKLLPLATPAVAPVLDIGTVSGYDPNDPRYRGN